MKRNYTALHVAAIVIGGACLGVDIWSNVVTTHSQTKDSLDPAIAAVIVVAIATSITLAAAYNAFRTWRIITGIILSLAFTLGSVLAIGLTLDRVSEQRDAKMANIYKADQIWSDTFSIERASRKNAGVQCTTMDISTKRSRGPACLGAEEQLAAVVKQRKARELELDSFGIRINAMVPMISVENAAIYFPCILPVVLFMMANWLLAFGIDGEKVEEEFNTEAKGRYAVQDKAARYAEAFYEKNNRWPKWNEVAETLEVTPAVAKRLAKNFG